VGDVTEPDDPAMSSPGDFGSPIHPDDRLWRHPSELAAVQRPTPAPPTRSVRPMGKILLGVTIATASVTAAWWATSQMELDSDEAAPVIARRTVVGVDSFVATTATLNSMSTGEAPHGFIASDRNGSVVVISVQPGGAALHAGLSSGDRILGVGGIATRSLSDMSSALAIAAGARSVSLTIERNDQIMVMSLPLDS